MVKYTKNISQATAEEMGGNFRTAMISISRPWEPDPSLCDEFGAVLRLKFTEDGHSGEGFRLSHAEQIHNFLEGLNPEIERVYVHCMYGMNRSGAVCKHIADRYGLPDSPRFSDHSPYIYQALTAYWLEQERKKDHDDTQAPQAVQDHP